MDEFDMPVPPHIWEMKQICPRCNGVLHRSGSKATSPYVHDDGGVLCKQNTVSSN